MVTRDIIKSGVNVPLLGGVSIGGLFIIGALAFFLFRTKTKKKSITVSV